VNIKDSSIVVIGPAAESTHNVDPAVQVFPPLT
jgi:hypothetical protein